MNLIPRTPVWVIVQKLGDHRTEKSFVRMTQSGALIPDQYFVDCSRWNDKEIAISAMDNQEHMVLYRVDEMEDGSDRLFLKLTREY